MSTTEMTIADAANEALEHISRIELPDDSHTYRPNENAPTWVRDLFYNNGATSDWATDKVDSLLRDIGGGDLTNRDQLASFADSYTSTYNGDRLEWLNKDDNAVAFVNEALDDFGGKDLMEILGMGQYRQIEAFVSCARGHL